MATIESSTALNRAAPGPLSGRPRMGWREPLLMLSLRTMQPTTYRELKLLRRLDRAPAAEIQALHEQRLTALLRHAFEQTDYYREVLGDCGVVRDGKVDLSRFDTLPILTKEIIRSQRQRLRARTLPEGRKAFVNKTGGSTGQQVEYDQDNYYWDINVATKLYHFEILGKRLGDPELKVWGSVRDVSDETAEWRRRAANWLYNRRIVTCTELSPPDIDRIIDEINAFRPATVWGYIDGLYTISTYINQHGRRLHAPVAVLSGGGTLLPTMVEPIQRAFGAPVINYYGSREMGDVACGCTEADGLHISMNSHKVETLDPREKPVIEEDGDLILTSLHNYAMPFIRYRIGDRGQLTRRACACGRPFPLLASVSGRTMEAFIRADGRVISPLAFVRTVRVLAEPTLIDRLQFVQETHTHVLVRVVPAQGAASEALQDRYELIRERTKELMGQDCEVTFETVPAIPTTASGKYLYTVSKVRPTAAGLEGFRN